MQTDELTINISQGDYRAGFIVDENVKNEFKEGDAENMHDEDDYSCKVEEDVIHQELILNENPVILL